MLIELVGIHMPKYQNEVYEIVSIILQFALIIIKKTGS